MRTTGTIEDRLAVRELVENYADAVFQRDAAQWGENWTADATWSIAGREIRVRDQIVAVWTDIMGQYPFVGMYLTSGGCALDGDRGEGRWYVLDVGATASGEDLCTFGRYHDRYARDTDGVWRFLSRRYEVLRVLPSNRL